MLFFLIQPLHSGLIARRAIVNSLLQAFALRRVAGQQRFHVVQRPLRRLIAGVERLRKAQHGSLRAVRCLDVVISAGHVCHAAFDFLQRQIVNARVKNMSEQLHLVLRG